MKDRICTHCYYVGQPIPQGLGSFTVDVLIWLIFISLAILSSFFYIIIIPIAWTTYHIAIYKKSTCPKCHRINMVSLNSSKGRKALRGPKVVVSYSAANDPERQNEANAPAGERRGRRASERGQETATPELRRSSD